jgi:hypothetical protein
MQRFILATILIAGVFSLSATEKCYLEALKGDVKDYAYDRDEVLLKEAMRDYYLLPKEVQDKFEKCPKGTFNDGCGQVFGEENCVTYGMVRVKKCDRGFERIDTGLCAEECPPETKKDAGGALCTKPKVHQRTIYKDEGLCVTNHSTCEQFSGAWASGCPALYKSLGPTMCAYVCPVGFTDTPAHCVPRLQQTPEYFLPRFERPLEGLLKDMEG